MTTTSLTVCAVLGASYRYWVQPMPVATKFFKAFGLLLRMAWQQPCDSHYQYAFNSVNYLIRDC